MPKLTQEIYHFWALSTTLMRWERTKNVI